MGTSGRFFLGLVAITAVVILGLAVLPAVTATQARSGAGGQVLPTGLSALWLAWMFALWGTLVAVMVFLIVWVGESLATDEEARATDDPAQDGAALVLPVRPAAVPLPEHYPAGQAGLSRRVS